MYFAALDTRFDLSLRFLSLLVSGAIALALVWHFAGVLQPLMRLGEAPLPAPPASAATPADVSGPPAWAAASEAGDLPLGRAATPVSAVTVFRCEQRGRISYSDRPCDQGGMRVLHLPPG